MMNWKVSIYLIVVFAIIFRLWGITWGFPYLYHPDEGIMVKIALGFFTGDMNPHHFLYPTLSMYLLFVVYAFWYGGGLLSGNFSSLMDFENILLEHPDSFFLVGRLFVATCGVLTIIVLYKLIKKYFDRTSAIFASFFLSISSLHVHHSKYATVDVPFVFFTIGAIYYILMISTRNDVKPYILAGIMSACAINTKQTGVFLIAPFFLAHYLYSDGAKGIIVRLFSRKLAFYCLAIAIALFLTSPYVFLDFKTFWDFVLMQREAVQRGWLGGDLSAFSWTYYLQFLTLGSKENLGILIFAVAGICFGILKKRREIIIFATFPIVYFLIVGSWRTHFPRYAIPLLPFIAGFAGIGVSSLVSIRIFKERVPQAIMLVLLIISVTLSIARVIMLDITLSHDDTRTRTKKWIEINIPAGSKIAYELYSPQLHVKDKGAFELINMKKNSIVSLPINAYVEQDVDYIILSSFIKGRYYKTFRATGKHKTSIYRYETLKREAELIKVFEPDKLKHTLRIFPKFLIEQFFAQELISSRHYPTIEVYKLKRKIIK